MAFASHHWPRWGAADIERWLSGQRDMYRYIHDETMRLANLGLTPIEIAEEVVVPSAVADEFFNREYYGTVSHNVKAVYQRYLGWFDANPANLHPLPPTATAHKMVEYMGGAAAVLERAHRDFLAGDFRWVAQVVNHLVFADPSNRAARLLQADALEQLGYQSESGPWRAFYLTGAQELRQGSPRVPGLRAANRVDVMGAMTPQMILDNCGVKLNGPRAGLVHLEFDVTFTDHNQSYRLVVAHGVINYGNRRTRPADATVTTTVSSLAMLTTKQATLVDETATVISGNVEAFSQFIDLLDQFDLFFNIIEP